MIDIVIALASVAVFVVLVLILVTDLGMELFVWLEIFWK